MRAALLESSISDDELEAYTDALFQLTALDNPSRAQVEAIELLTLLVERYDSTTRFRLLIRFPWFGFSLKSRISHSAI